jgi:hypothetical protein
MHTKTRKPPAPWVVPALVAAMGVPTFLAFWVGGRPQLGLVWAGVSVALGLLLAFGGRIDTIQILRGSADDERTLALDAQATAMTALVLVAALAVLFLAAGVRGESGVTYGVLLLLAEATHVGALAVLNRRS